MNKQIWVIGLLSPVLVVLVWFILQQEKMLGHQDIDVYTASILAEEPIESKKEIGIGNTILAVGDMMLGTNYPNANSLPPFDGQYLLDSVAPILRKGDITIGNLEGVLLTGKGPAKYCTNPQNCYAFKSPDHYAGYMKKAGFDALCVANNHSGDFGAYGRKHTAQVLKQYNLGNAGAADKPYTILRSKGVKYGICAFAPNRGTASILDHANAQTIVRKLKTKCDVVIVFFHGGAEGIAYRHITRKPEIYLCENRGNPYKFAHDVIDAGADLVLGHGPHVTRAMDLYKGRLIAYSLGNFCTYGKFSLGGSLGVAPIMEITLKPDGAFLKGQVHAIKQTKNGGPKLDSSKQALYELARLTKEDIPEAPLRFYSSGAIRPK